MKKLWLLPVIAIFLGCNISEDCIRNSGSMETKELTIGEADITSIYVYPNISLVLAQGEQNSVVVMAGSNVIDDISVTVDGNSLVLKDNSGCNLSRQYGNKTVVVTAKSAGEMNIISNTSQVIKSQGTLSFPTLRLFAMDSFGGVGTGDFIMNVDNGQLVVESNNVALFKITGATNELLLRFYDGLSRFEGADFEVQSINIFHRSANDMIIRPIQSLTGNIYSTGNVISKTHPPIVEVVQHYSGKIIYD